MTVDVLLFASYAEALGTNALSLDLRPGARVRDLLAEVRLRPGAGRLPERVLVAVNQQYARPDHELAAGDEIALIPPTAGG